MMLLLLSGIDVEVLLVLKEPQSDDIFITYCYALCQFVPCLYLETLEVCIPYSLLHNQYYTTTTVNNLMTVLIGGQSKNRQSTQYKAHTIRTITRSLQ